MFPLAEIFMPGVIAGHEQVLVESKYIRIERHPLAFMGQNVHEQDMRGPRFSKSVWF